MWAGSWIIHKGRWEIFDRGIFTTLNYNRFYSVEVLFEWQAQSHMWHPFIWYDNTLNIWKYKLILTHRLPILIYERKSGVGPAPKDEWSNALQFDVPYILKLREIESRLRHVRKLPMTRNSLRLLYQSHLLFFLHTCAWFLFT